ncbi:membrane protein, partial [Lactiplantibacillus plantarum]
MQVMIITSRPKTVIDSVQNRIRRGVTIVHIAEGAIQHDAKPIIFTVITRYEMGELKAAMAESDPHA